MRRRDFITILGGTATTLPFAAQAQQEQTARRVPAVGFIGLASPAVDLPTLEPFRQGLKDLGYIEGRNIVIEIRNAEGDVNRGHALIAELAARPVDVFLSPGPALSRALAQKTKIPVVAVALPATQSEPGLFASLAHPGGTLTGFSAFGEEMSAKRIEMLREIIPGLKTLGVMHNATDPMFRAWGERTIEDARKQGIEPVQLGLDPSHPTPVAEQFRKLTDKGGTAMIVIRDFLTAAMKDDICKAGLDGRIAVMGEYGDFARGGALLSYGADLNDLFRRAAGYVDRILKGEKPADLPIQLPTKFELNMNLKTARALGLTIPSSLLVLADQVIE